jgi:DNA-binding MarR family transcriptional regulator
MHPTVDTIAESALVSGLWSKMTALRQRIMADLRGGLPALDALELTVPQSMVLFALVARGPLSITQLREVSGRSQSATSTLVMQLERRKLALRRDDPADARRTLVRATPKGTRMVAQVEGLRERSFASALALVPRDRVQRLDAALADVLAAMEVRR